VWHPVYECDCCVISGIWMWLSCDIQNMDVVVVWHSVYGCGYWWHPIYGCSCRVISGIWMWLLCDIRYMNVVIGVIQYRDVIVVWHPIYECGYWWHPVYECECCVTCGIWMWYYMLHQVWTYGYKFDTTVSDRCYSRVIAFIYIREWQ